MDYFGIGKSTLGEHVSNKVFNKKVARFPLTQGHDLLRLSLEMSTRSNTKILKSYSSQDELYSILLESAVILIKQDKVLFFDDVENALNDDGTLKDYFRIILEKLSTLENLPPILIATQYFPKLEIELQKNSHILKLGHLDDEYIVSILERWITLANPKLKIPDKKILNNVASELYGYPLAARLASYVIAKYSIEQVLIDLKHFKSIRIDIANQLIGRSRQGLNNLQKTILELLTISDSGLSQHDLIQIIKEDVEKIREAVDELYLDSFISIDLGLLQILPLMKDYFWNRSLKSGNWRQLSRQISNHCQNQLYEKISDEDFIRYCSMAYRLLILVDDYKGAKELTYQFQGELRGAAIKLFHAQDYSLSLKYANIWLEMNPNDHEIRLIKVRCLTREEIFEEAEHELKNLERTTYIRHKIFHAWGLFYKQKGNKEKAKDYFKRGLDVKPWSLPLLRDYGDVLDQLGEIDEAFKQLEKAHSLSPRDRFITPKYAALLEKKGRIDDAIEIMSDLKVTFPDEAAIYHRLSMLNCAKGNFKEAYLDAKMAVDLNKNLHESITHLAALELRKNDIKETERLLNLLPEKIPFVERRIRDTIFAEMQLKEGKFDDAREQLKTYKYIEDTYCADTLARIEYEEAKFLIAKKHNEAAREKIKRGLEIVKNTLGKFPNNYQLEESLKQLTVLQKRLE
ncbi:MAG: hypothetical protein WC593_00675 [Methanoregula sp.]